MNRKVLTLAVNVAIMLAFSLAYHFIGMEGNFNLPFKPDVNDKSKRPDWFFSTYFSTITHSTAGFGDCYPTTGLSRTLVVMHLWTVVLANVMLMS